MFGTAVRVVLWSLVLAQGVQLVVNGVKATSEGMNMPDEEPTQADQA